ncbi:DUF4214 domain-containing protein [Marinobacter xestospongiae]|uniref:DUF4214 domain-containing protein n=1 Tax=Marinobacter xestospongiae TaxID=994319 RepID=UPI0020039E09|nr:DUF4214 domain-containing protein [Marinobacter xestospongiae]MCK7569096.1 DUF4214 domain-containing protein [Marinobacter xestospongiae]
MAFNSNELGVIRTYVAITGEAPTQSEFEAAFETTGMDALATALLEGRPQQSNQAFVESLYQNLLGRAADAEGLQYWTSLLSASAGQNQLSKARLAAEFQNSAAQNAADEPGLVDGTTGLTSVDGDFKEPGPVGPEPDLDFQFEFDTSKGASDVKGWTHTESDETGEVSEENGADTYMSNTHKIYNVGMNAIDQGTASISRDYTFSAENQLGDHGHYEAYFLSPILDNVVTNLGTTLTVEVIDRMAEANNKDAALSLVAIESFSFRLNGEQVVVGSDDILNATTYEELEAAIEARINELAVDNEALKNVSVDLGADFTRQQVDPDTLVTTGANVLGTQIVITATGSNVIERGGFSFGERSGVDRNVDPSGRQDTEVLGSESSLISTNLEFKNIGYGSQGGSVNVSGQSLSETGVEEFNVTAEKHDLGLGVWLTELSSQPLKNRAKNTLEVINLTGNADYFHVGEEQSAALNDQEGAVLAGKENAGITDVRFFNASQFNQNVKLNAQVTDDVIARDLNRGDGADDAAADNVVYTYNLGGGNNDLFLSFSQSVIAHEDAALSITTGNGNDKVHLVLDNDDAAPSNWYSNQKDQKNIVINTGSGNDTVTTEGAGDATIVTGAGADTVYADNSGEQGFDLDNDAATADEFFKAHWVFNSENLDVQDLLGGSGSPLTGTTGESGPYFLYESTLTVTLSGAGATPAGGLTGAAADAFANGFEVTVDVPTGQNYAATERQINQAIKDAINNNAVMNKLLVAIDGPNDTLIVRSLIDGTFNNTDLDVNIQTGTLPTAAAELSQLQAAWEAFNNTSNPAALDQAALQAQVDALVNPANTDGHYEGAGAWDNTGAETTAADAILGQLDDAGAATDVTGADSAVESNNVINVGVSQDVVVMGTGANSNDMLVYTGYNNGENTVVNFVQDDDGVAGVNQNGVDFINFTSYLTTEIDASGSGAGNSANPAPVEFEAAGSINGNTVSIITFAGDGGNAQQTWDNLSASNLVALLNGTAAFGDAANTAAFDAYDADNGETNMGSGAIGAIIGNTNNHIFMVENDANDGEYKIFHVTSTRVADADAGSFNTSAQLVGTVDLGASLSTNELDMELSLVGSAEWAAESGLA